MSGPFLFIAAKLTPRPNAEIARAIVREFPKAKKKTLAHLLMKRHPEVFLNLELARTTIRYVTGASGKANRKKVAGTDTVRELGTIGDPFGKLPEGKSHFVEWDAVQFHSPRVLVLSDIHLPYHDQRAVWAALQYGLERNPTMILLNGDSMDFFAVSRWESDPRERDLPAEIETGRAFLAMLRAAFPKTQIVFKVGNHEERWERYLSCKAPELLGVEEFDLKSILHFDRHGIECVGEMRPIRIGKLNVIHGHEYKFSISNPVNPARGFFLRAKTHVLGGHLHQSSNHSEKNLEGKVVSTWSTGCLCDLHPNYRPLNNWNHGFAFVECATDGEFNVSNLKIIHGKVY